MKISIETETTLSFAIVVDDVVHILKLKGGEWLYDDRWIAQGRVSWQDALYRALKTLHPERPLEFRIQKWQLPK